MKIFKQSTIETCLPACLLTLLKFYKKISIKKTDELNILCNGLKIVRIDYSTGQLSYVCKKYKVAIEEYIEYPIFFKKLKKYKLNKNLMLKNRKIDINFLKNLISKSPIIIFLDQYYIYFNSFHASHFVILLYLDKNKAKIIDPWKGKEFEIHKIQLRKAISSLRNKLKISPKAIRII